MTYVSLVPIYVIFFEINLIVRSITLLIDVVILGFHLILKIYIIMKNLKLFHILSMAVIALVVVACEGPVGPAGADGKDGANGLNGSDGKDGVDGNVVCLQCHTLANKAAKEMQYKLSTHYLSNIMYDGRTVYQYAGYRQDCGRCHSHEGYVETRFTGADTLMADLGVVHNIQCATCHDFHSTLDFENDGKDYALRDPSSEMLITTGEELDLGGPDNTCIHCHQARTAPPDMTLDSFTVTSSYWGPHHGPQANVLQGIGGFEFTGSATYPDKASHPHRKDAKCTTCHMDDFTNDAGGHTFSPNVDNCKKCHTSATDFDIKGVQTDITSLLDQIEAKLKTAGILSDKGSLVTGKYPINVAGAYFNWALCGHEDKSEGVHNPPYVKALLTNTLENL